MKDKSFLKALTYIALPIILQNLMYTAVGTADTFMLNFVGQTELSAVSLANQPQFVLSLFYMGLTSGTGIMMAQYLGKGDKQAANFIFRFALNLTLMVSAVFALLAICLPQLVMRVFTNEAALIQTGGVYLRVVGVSYLLSAFSQVYLVTLKTNQRVRKSLLISIVTLLVNVVLNAVVIFGLLGMPRMGVIGVAVATVVSRLIELALCLIDWSKTKLVSLSVRRNDGIRRDYLRVTCPIMAQGFVWGGAMATLSAIMGRMGSDAVAANSLAAVIQNIATVASFGLAEGGSILLGHTLGRGDLTGAKRDAGTLLWVSVTVGVVCCGLMLLAEGPVTSVLNLTEQSLGYFHMMYKILSVNVIFAAITYTTLNGIFPSGGDTKFGLYVDAAVMWGFCVFLGGIAAFVLKLPPLAVFVIVNLDEFIKTPVVLIRYTKSKWLYNLTESEGSV